MPAVSSPCAGGVSQSTCGENFVLGWLILKCVRGTQGVQHIGKFLVANYREMVHDFPAFCTHLIQHGEELCAKYGQTFLAHREGFHCSLSGMCFLRTLSNESCRAALLTFARACGDHVTRLMQNGCKSKVGSHVFLKLMEELSSITLAVRAGGKQLHMSRYNIMDSARCFLAILEKSVGCSPMGYTDEEHAWMMKRQCTKIRTETVRDMMYFKIADAASMREFIFELEHRGAVRAANVFVLCCEGRQCGNHYGMPKLRALVTYARACGKRGALKQELDSKQDELAESGGAGKCHTLQMLQVVERFAGRTLARYRPAGSASVYDRTRLLLDC